MTDSSYEVNNDARVLKTDMLAQREATLDEFECSG